MEAKKGIDVILLYRILKEANKTAFKLAFQTEHSVEKSRDTETIETKDGKIQTLSNIEYDFSATSIMAKSDEMVEKLEKAFDDGEIVEIWEVDTTTVGSGNSEGKYKGTYYQGYISKFGKSANAEDALELELEFAINGKGVGGWVTLTEEQKKVTQYEFKDTTAE